MTVYYDCTYVHLREIYILFSLTIYLADELNVLIYHPLFVYKHMIKNYDGEERDFLNDACASFTVPGFTSPELVL